MHSVCNPLLLLLLSLPPSLSLRLSLFPPPFHIHASFKDTFGSIDVVKRDIEEAKQKLSEFTSPIVFCHNDLLIGNLIFDEETGEREREREREREQSHHSSSFSVDTVGMIDFEYGGSNYLAYDIANHFCEFAGACIIIII